WRARSRYYLRLRQSLQGDIVEQRVGRVAGVVVVVARQRQRGAVAARDVGRDLGEDKKCQNLRPRPPPARRGGEDGGREAGAQPGTGFAGRKDGGWHAGRTLRAPILDSRGGPVNPVA